MTQADEIRPEDELVKDCVRRLGQEAFGTGPLAELRRMDPRHPEAAPPALHRLLANLPDECLGEPDFRRWALFVHLLALAAPDRHHGGPPLGRALLSAGYSEGRLTRLLEAPEAEFAVVLPRMVRFLVARGGRLNPFELADLVLRRDKAPQRLRIARHYFRAEAAEPAAA